MEKQLDFEKSLNRLNEIVDKINSDIPLDESLALYQEGKALIKELEEALKAAEEKVEKIIETK